MTTVATLDMNVIDVVPGTEVTCGLEIRNAGEIVEAYQLDVLGDPARWATVEPPAVSVFPGEAVRVTLVLRPPRAGGPPSGELPFAVRVTPSQQPETAVVPEGTVRVLPFAETSAEIRPRTSKGRRSGRHEVAIDNRGNVPVTVAVTGTDPDDALKVTARPQTLAIGPGQAVFAKVRATNRRRLWTGQPETRPFQVIVEPAADDTDIRPIVLDGTTLQLPMIPRGAGKALVGLLVLALLGTGLWFGLLKPAVDSAAKEAAEDAMSGPLAELAGQAGKAASDAAEANQRAGALEDVLASPGTGLPPAPPTGSDVFRHRFENEATAGNPALSRNPLVVPPETTLVITDLILQNPQGDTGRLDILVDDVSVYTVALQNFRDLDYKVVTPIEVPAGQQVTVRIDCVEPGDPLAGFTSPACRVFVLALGFDRVDLPATPAPAP